MAQGLTDSSFRYHLTTAKNNGVTKTEIAEILTHAAFYAGWSKAWAAFRMAKEVWAEDDAADAKAEHQNEMVFPIGTPNDAFAKYFIGQSYLAPLSTQQPPTTTPQIIIAATFHLYEGKNLFINDNFFIGNSIFHKSRGFIFKKV